MKTFLTLTVLLMTASIASATSGRYVLTTGATGISFKLPYTGGTHTGLARVAKGGLATDPDDISQVTAHIIVPIANLQTGDDKRDCHMREALGLDYSKSKYPKDHACDNNHTLPQTGPDSVVYPNIEFIVDSVSPSTRKLVVGAETPINVTGRFLIHGVARQVTFPATVTLDAQNQIHFTTRGGIKLADYGIVVKKFLFITVGDSATVDLHLTFARTP